MGTTQEGAVDPLRDIVTLRDQFAAKALMFAIHADTAWGGYFSTMIPRNNASIRHEIVSAYERHVSLGLREETSRNIAALKDVDSVTVDPHKTGYVPYPAGGLCYRDGRMRHLLAWPTPYIEEGFGEHVGVHGVDGSKPGAAAAAVWLAHIAIGLDENGYGALHRRALLGSCLLSSHLATMSDDLRPFIVVPFNRLPSELVEEPSQENINAEKTFIRERILGVGETHLVDDSRAIELLNRMGSELRINLFVWNFRRPDGSINSDIRLSNRLNQHIFKCLSAGCLEESLADVPFFTTSTTLMQKDYGEGLSTFKKRAHLQGDEDLYVLRSVVMSPFVARADSLWNMTNTLKRILEEEVQNLMDILEPCSARL